LNSLRRIYDLLHPRHFLLGLIRDMIYIARYVTAALSLDLFAVLVVGCLGTVALGPLLAALVGGMLGFLLGLLWHLIIFQMPQALDPWLTGTAYVFVLVAVFLGAISTYICLRESGSFSRFEGILRHLVKVITGALAVGLVFVASLFATGTFTELGLLPQLHPRAIPLVHAVAFLITAPMLWSKDFDDIDERWLSMPDE